jgi:hypothetical protein
MLAEAREEARRCRAIARDDGDPFAEKRRARRVVPTFRQAAKTVHKEQAKAWKNAKHGELWINTLEACAFPAFGDRRVNRSILWRSSRHFADLADQARNRAAGSLAHRHCA